MGPTHKTGRRAARRGFGVLRDGAAVCMVVQSGVDEAVVSELSSAVSFREWYG
jgi:hypothetical protein